MDDESYNAEDANEEAQAEPLDIMGIPISLVVKPIGAASAAPGHNYPFDAYVTLGGESSGSYKYVMVQTWDKKFGVLLKQFFKPIENQNPVIVPAQIDNVNSGDSYRVMAFACDDTNGSNSSAQFAGNTIYIK